jgi:mono/diheme cytochrome c family protein
MAHWARLAVPLIVVVALLPFACIARARVMQATQPRVHLIPDMDNQGRYKSQQSNPLFVDRRAMRAPVAGTVARGQLRADDAFERGIVGEAYVEQFPFALDAPLMARGRERYDIYCAPCHGLAGQGDGIVARRADRLQQGTWVPPASLHDEPASTRPVGHIYNTITHGIRTMPAYGSQIPAQDRWAIVAYVRALQRSQRASLTDVPSEQRSALR